jgi:hypothetical protein
MTAHIQNTSGLSTAGLFWFNAGKGRFVSDGTNIVGLLFFELIFLAFRIMFTVRTRGYCRLQLSASRPK